MRRPATKFKPAPTRAATPASAQPRFPVWLMVVMLVLVTIAVYWPATRSEFVNIDDSIQVTSNWVVQRGLTWQGIKWVFSKPVPDNWQPLTALSHMAICQACGLKPWGHHLANVVLHALNAGLVLALLQLMTGATWRSLLVAALFAVHPLGVEAVAWVTERKGLLSGFFGLLALLAYARYAQLHSLKSKVQSLKSRIGSHAPQTTGHASPIKAHVSRFTFLACGFYLLSLFFLACGLMSKPTLVTLPFVMLLLDYWPLGRLQLQTPGSRLKTSLPLLVEKLPFFALAALDGVVTFIVQQREGALVANESLPLFARGANALISYCRYLGKLFWPTNLAVYYPHPGDWPGEKVLLAGGFILGVSVLLWVLRRRYPFLLIGWLWYCGSLVPVSQVVQTGSHAMADRWTYLPSLGVLILVIWGSCELTRRFKYQALAALLAGGAAIVLCLALTRQQIGYWRDSETLFRHALEVTENNWLAHDDLGVALGQKGQLDEAIRQIQEAVRLHPHYAEAHYNLGVVLVGKGQTDAAIRQFEEAIRLKPDLAEAHNNLGNALRIKGQTAEAIRRLQEAVRLKPDFVTAHNNLGLALAQHGEIDGAIRQFQETLRLKPDDADARKNLGVLLAHQTHAPQPQGAAKSP
jgi:protein O-mannosyl-transferase